MQNPGTLLTKLTRLSGMLKEQRKSLEQELLLEDELLSWLQMTSESIRQTARYILIKDTNRFGHKTPGHAWDFRTSTETKNSYANGSGILGLNSPWKDPFFTTRKTNKPTSNRGGTLLSTSSGKDQLIQMERRPLDRVAFFEARKSSTKPQARLDMSGSLTDYRNRNSSQNSANEVAQFKANAVDLSGSQLTPAEQQVLSKYTTPNIYKQSPIKSDDLLKPGGNGEDSQPKKAESSNYYVMSRHRPMNSLGAVQALKEIGAAAEKPQSSKLARASVLQNFLYTGSRDTTDRLKSKLDESQKTEPGPSLVSRPDMKAGSAGRLPFGVDGKPPLAVGRQFLEIPTTKGNGLSRQPPSSATAPKLNVSLEVPSGPGLLGPEVDPSVLLEERRPYPPGETNKGILLTDSARTRGLLDRPAKTERPSQSSYHFADQHSSRREPVQVPQLLNFHRSNHSEANSLYSKLVLPAAFEPDKSGTGGSHPNFGKNKKGVPSSLPTSNRHLHPDSKSALKLSKSILYLTMSQNPDSGKIRLIEGSHKSSNEYKSLVKTSSFINPFEIPTLTIAEVEVDPSEPSETANIAVDVPPPASKSDRLTPVNQLRQAEGSQSKAEGTAQFPEGFVSQRSGDSLEKFREGWVDPYAAIHKAQTSSQAILNRGMTFSDVSVQARSQKSGHQSPSRSQAKERFFFQPVNKLNPEQE